MMRLLGISPLSPRDSRSGGMRTSRASRRSPTALRLLAVTLAGLVTLVPFSPALAQSGPTTLRFFLHGTDIPGTADGFTMNATPTTSQVLNLNLLNSPRWYSDPPLTGRFGALSRFTLHVPCLLALTVGSRYTLAITDVNGGNVTQIGQRNGLLGLCLGSARFQIPAQVPQTLVNQRLRLTFSTLVSTTVNLRVGPGTFLEATRFTPGP
jgi:hypothetical protein